MIPNDSGYMIDNETLRYEIKMVVQGYALPVVRSFVYSHAAGFITAFPRRIVNNIYYDSNDFQSLEHHLCGVVQRYKIRFRWYGTNNKHITGIIEIKNKRDRLSWKQQAVVPGYIDLDTMTWNEINQVIQGYLPDDIRIMFEVFRVPVFINSYLREYYVSPTTGVRITLDYNIRGFEQWSSIRPNICAPMLLPDTLVIEFKAFSHQHDALSEVLDSFPLRPVKNSKFISCIHSMIY